MPDEIKTETPVQQPEAAPKRPSVWVAVPVARQMTHAMVQAFFSALGSTQKCDVHEYQFLHNDSLIARVRSLQLSHFFHETKDDYYFHVSDDIEMCDCTPDNNIFDKLTAHGLDFVGAVYAATCDPYKPTTRMADGMPPLRNTGLREVVWLSGGCWLLSRAGIAKMIEAYPELTVRGDIHPRHGKPVHMLFDEEIVNLELKPGITLKPEDEWMRRKYLSEDYAYGERWRRIGGRIYADTSIRLRHWGVKPFEVPDAANLRVMA